MQDMGCCDYIRTPVIFWLPDNLVFIGDLFILTCRLTGALFAFGAGGSIAVADHCDYRLPPRTNKNVADHILLWSGIKKRVYPHCDN